MIVILTLLCSIQHFTRSLDPNTPMDSYTISAEEYNQLNGYKLHTAKFDWKGTGVTFKYKDTIKVMSEKLLNREGFITYDRKLTANQQWAMTIDFQIHNVHTEHGEGMGIWLTKERPGDVYAPHGLEGQRMDTTAMGMEGPYEGFGVFAKANSTERYDEDFYVLNRVGGNLDQKSFMDGAKICRRPIKGKDATNRIVIEYSHGSITTMIKEKDGLHYCESRQMDLSEFYLTFSGKSQKNEAISIAVKNVFFKTDIAIEGIEYWPEQSEFNSKQLIQSVHDSVKQESDMIKIYRSKFRDIQTKKPAQIFKLLFSSDKKISKQLAKDVEDLDIISQQIKVGLSSVNSDKHRMENKFGEYVTKIQNWLTSMSDIYDGMEVEMDEIIKKLTALKINERVAEVSAKMKKVIDQLERMTNTSSLYSKHSKDVEIFLEKVVGMQTEINNHQADLNSRLGNMKSSGYDYQKSGRWIVSWSVTIIAGLVVFITVKAHNIVNKRTSRLL